MIKLTLKDGSIRELEAPTAAAEVIKGIGMGLYKASCCVKLDGEVCDLRTVIDHDCTFDDVCAVALGTNLPVLHIVAPYPNVSSWGNASFLMTPHILSM